MSPASVSQINQFLVDIVPGPSAVFAVLFAISCGVHIWQNSKYRCWPHTWPLPCACLLTTAAFICREVVANKHDPDDLASPIQGLFYSAAPTFTLPIYTVFLVSSAYGEVAASLRPSIWCFIIAACPSAIITLTANGSATYYVLDTPEGTLRADLAQIKASLFLQLILNATVIFVAMFLLIRALCVRQRKQRFSNGDGANKYALPPALLLSLLILTSLIAARNVFRTVQIYAPPTSAIWTDEVYFWLFEACVMLGYTTLFHTMHLGAFVTTYRCGSES